MFSLLFRYTFTLIAIVLFSFIIVMFLNPEVLRNAPLMNDPNIQTFKAIFIGITLQAFPFILLGVILSSLLQVFVPDSFVQRLIPRNPFLGAIVASGLGIIFPICECGMVPVARRLIRKGFPLYAGIIFLLAGPIINPVVYSATLMAFRSNPSIAYSRMALAFVVATVAGLIVYKWIRSNPMKEPIVAQEHRHSYEISTEKGVIRSKFLQTFDHAASEFFDMGKYLIFGAFITAILQTFVPRRIIVDIAASDIGSNLFMMGFAYILSICSTADAFVASSFAATFPSGSLLAFLVFGPMLDVKSTLMLLSVFRARFVLKLTVIVATLVAISSYLAGIILE
jgi:uncharacterized membrane protein YraQ (UPF0718 family)